MGQYTGQVRVDLGTNAILQGGRVDQFHTAGCDFRRKRLEEPRRSGLSERWRNGESGEPCEYVSIFDLR